MKTMRSPASPPLSFRTFLREELARRCAANAAYSLRAFARRLEIHHSTLSQFLRGRRPLTPRSIRRLGQRLGLDAARCDAFVRAEPTGSTVAAPPAEAVQLARDTARVVADWTHFAILELTHLEHFRPDVRWIARVLGITADEVNVAVTRLVRLRLLELRRGAWIDCTGDAVATSEDLGLAALARLSARFAEGRVDRPAASFPGGGLHTLTTLAIDSAALPAAIARLERFRDELLRSLAAGGRSDSVIQLEIHLTTVAATPPEA